MAKRAILTALAEGPKTGLELSSSLGVDRNGHLSAHLDELELAGFVAKDSGLNPETGQAARQDRYRLRDNYTRFYLRYIEPREAEIKAGLRLPRSLVWSEALAAGDDRPSRFVRIVASTTPFAARSRSRQKMNSLAKVALSGTR